MFVQSYVMCKMEEAANFAASYIFEAIELTAKNRSMIVLCCSIDGNQLLTDDLKLKVFSPMISNDGKTLPYGLGWFISKRKE